MATAIIPVPEAQPGDVLLKFGWANSETDFGWDRTWTGYGLTIQSIAPVNEDGKQIITFVDDAAMATWRESHPQWTEELWADPMYRMEVDRP